MEIKEMKYCEDCGKITLHKVTKFPLLLLKECSVCDNQDEET